MSASTSDPRRDAEGPTARRERATRPESARRARAPRPESADDDLHDRRAGGSDANPSEVAAPPLTNAELYRDGKRLAEARERLTAGRKSKPTYRAVAKACGADPDSAQKAVAFAGAVDLIVLNCGGDAKALLLSDHPRLPARKVLQVARTHADRQQSALERARDGLDPLGKPLAGTDPPFDTHDCREVLSRLARNAGALQLAADRLLTAESGAWPGGHKLKVTLEQLGDVTKACKAMAKLSNVASGKLKERNDRAAWKARAAATPVDARDAVRYVASVREMTDKNLRDLPRVLRDTPPTAGEANELCVRVRDLMRAAKRLKSVIKARGHDPRTGPSGAFGTYVVIYRLARPVGQQRIGDLGTFDFPAGYYAYLGSAFGGGGVRKRTGHHLKTECIKKWNVDWLKQLCVPVAAWWTHERVHVEFDWADRLAELPGATFPAPRFGAADNPKARAHLVHFDRMPSVADFRRLVEAAMPGHAPVFEQVVENWAGMGWPD